MADVGVTPRPWMFSTISACRSCGSTALFPVLDLGHQPLANAYRDPGDTTEERQYPLALVGCRACSLVQLTGSVPPPSLFDSYPYFSSYSTTWVESMRALAARMVCEHGLGPESLVVEVASNDGYLLGRYLEMGIPVLGADPAANVVAVAQSAGVPTVVDYFGLRLAKELRNQGRRADVLHANNVLAHVPDVNDLVAGIATVLADDGVAVIETPYVVRLVEDARFDTVYHEHVFYYSLTAICVLAQRHGLAVGDLEEVADQGGSLRVFLHHAGRIAPGTAVSELLDHEARLRIAEPIFYDGFAARVEEVRRVTVAALTKWRRDGASIAGYGAAAKATVLLNHFGIDGRIVDFVVDLSEHKQGLLMPGVGIPICHPRRLVEAAPDYVLLLVWNLAAEVVEQQAEYRRAGGQFVIPGVPLVVT